MVGAMVSLENQITASSDLSAYDERQNGIPARAAFVAFIANQLRANLSDHATEIRIEVSRASRYVFKLSGSVTLNGRVTPIVGDIHWLPNLDCFRGHVTVDPEGRVNTMLAEDADAVRAVDWRKSKWDGEDHDHCRLCWATLSTNPSEDGFDLGYTAKNSGWLCPNCYNDVVVNGGAHPWLKQK